MNFKLWFLAFSFSLLAFPTNTVKATATAQDISNLAEIMKLTTNTFTQESFTLRMQYEYSGGFLSKEDKDRLGRLAKRAGDDLEAVIRNQRQLKEKIENYQGRDWDIKYGVTGLWRKIFADLYISSLSKCKIDFYSALTAAQAEKNMTLHKILSRLDLLDKTYGGTPTSRLLRTRVLAKLSVTEPNYKAQTMKQLDLLTSQADITKVVYFKAVMEKIKLAGQSKTGQLEKLVEEIKKSDYAEDPEMILTLAFLQFRYEPKAIEKTVSLWPETDDLLGSFILSDLAGAITVELIEQKLQKLTIFEAELAAQTAWKSNPQEYKLLLEHLSSKFQTPLILYVAAAASAEQAPAKSVNLLVKASALQQEQNSEKLDIEADKIAKQAAQLAYNLFLSDSKGCQLVLEAFENYSAIAEGKIDEELEYLHTVVLNDCGRSEKSRKLLGKIADRPAGKRRHRAKLDLIIRTIHQGHHKNKTQQNEILQQLKNLIEECSGQSKEQNRIRTEAVTIYCQLLIEREDKQSAQMVLNILSEAKHTRNLTLTQIKSKALRLSGRLEEAASCLAEVIIIDSGSLAGEAMILLSEIIEDIDRLKSEAKDFDKMMQDSRKLAELSFKTINDHQSGLFLAEISVFAANKERGELSEVDKLLNNLVGEGNTKDIDFLRCKARLFTEQGKFNEAAGLWSGICDMRKSETTMVNERSWQWWRAKFYELYCWSRITETKKDDVLHTIEILENSYTNIPRLWAEKLNRLKTTIRKRTI